MEIVALLNDGMILSNLERKVMDSSRRFILLISNAEIVLLHIVMLTAIKLTS